MISSAKMRKLKVSTILLLASILVANGQRNAKQLVPGNVNSGGFGTGGFSLFSVVKFKNTKCTSQDVRTPGLNREGICFTNSECTSMGGQASGTCSAGFGVCCLFFITNGAVNNNNSYIRNQGFPASFSGTAPTYTIRKCSDDICTVRLDFHTFDIGGPAAGNVDGTCQDSMTLASTNGRNYPVICGLNTGMHVYVEFGSGRDSTITAAFATLSSVISNRQWEIQVTQIECTNKNRPPTDCFQWHTTFTGTIKTFNYNDGSSPHLNEQNYKVCVRRQPGMCCIEYQQCDPLDRFSLRAMEGMGPNGAVMDPFDFTTGMGRARLDSDCSSDFIAIESAQANCDGSLAGTNHDRICGTVFAPGPSAIERTARPVCDCHAPFEVSIVTDNSVDPRTSFLSRGACLNFRQIPC